jgi:hypothetical protein
MKRLLLCALAAAVSVSAQTWTSVLGDPGMQAAMPSTAFSGWNFCNGALGPDGYPAMASPRMADCAAADGEGPNGNMISEADNDLAPGTPIPGFVTPTDVNEYARVKEVYLGQRCFKQASFGNWSGFSIMFKSGNMNSGLPICPRTNSTGVVAAASAHDASTYGVRGQHLRFNNLPMNQPLMSHGWSTPNVALPYNSTGWFGYYSGTYDVSANATASELQALQAALSNYTQQWLTFRIAEIASNSSNASALAPLRPTPPTLLVNKSFVFASWWVNKTSTPPSFVYYMAMQTTPTYPWLMNYLRTNDVVGGYGGYPWQGSGLMNGPVPATGTRLVVNLRVLDPGARQDQFYLPAIAGCWKLDGSPCTADPNTDVTRYICMIMAPTISASCSATNQGACPPFHWSINGTMIPRTDKVNFPYECYSMYCPPWGCDPYSNPVPQELMELRPCAEWAVHGFPAAPGDGWIGDDRTWTLDVGALGARMYMAGANPPSTPEIESRKAMLARHQGQDALPPYPGWSRSFLDFEIGPEQFDSASHMVRWEVSQVDVQVLQA